MPYKYLVDQQQYKLKSIEPSNPPEGAEGPDWFHYIIVQGSNTIYGYRQGDLYSITSSIEDKVTLLNERQFGKRGRVHLVTAKK